jgi:hypothetical protein
MAIQTTLEWLEWNINKFCVGFETVYSMNDHHLSPGNIPTYVPLLSAIPLFNLVDPAGGWMLA